MQDLLFLRNHSFQYHNMDKQYWLAQPEMHDFPAAQDFLELVFPAAKAKQLVAALLKAKTVTKKSKDVLRASHLPLLPKDNIHVKQNLKKLKKGEKLSPVLLVSGEPLIIADGYHRVCAIYYLSEDLEIPCRIVHRG
jgi:disulfide oxidoreductase YuzD